MGPRCCGGQTTRLPPRRTWFDFQHGRSRIFARGNRARRCSSSVGVFSGISRFHRPCIPVLHHTRLASPTSALNTSMLRAAQISLLHSPFQYSTYAKFLKNLHAEQVSKLHSKNQHECELLEDISPRNSKRNTAHLLGLGTNIYTRKRGSGIAEGRMEGARVCEAELVASSSHQTPLGRAPLFSIT
ncbi:hypothetical protein PR048_022215 [Dryococelus australis]|uniref:Uncharacterized protein n=1 Tax=Dryococelus australis TaxID=614101 RepID=A0ABQ9H0G4_9NEOP|nr:hypothetical protein PR048_022215 [Dryococelus australis]